MRRVRRLLLTCSLCSQGFDGSLDFVGLGEPAELMFGKHELAVDTDVEDAVCSALMALGVMSSSGNLSFRFRPRRELSDDVVEAVRDLSGAIPWRYFGTARI